MVISSFPVKAKNETPTISGVDCYKQFLLDHKNELLHNIDESIKSVCEKILRTEEIAWAQYEKLNKDVPSDDEDEEVRVYRYSKISKIAENLNAATEDLIQKKQDLMDTREKLYHAIYTIYNKSKNHGFMDTLCGQKQ